VPQSALVQPLRRWDPEQIDGYVLIGRLGAGAMGQVYLGRSAAGRLVAVKTIKTELAEEPDFRTRFGQEVAAARRVSGAFTAAVVAADSEADVPWLATVYVPAPSLTRLVRNCGPLPLSTVRWLAAGCAEALESIHGAGLVHRDLKPSNVLVSPDGPRVIDFGVARAAERIQLTVTRGSVGTPAYMAPEQARDTRQATPASDVFSLGATIVFAATGHAPYQGETVMDVLVRLATESPDLSGLPAELADIVTPCLDRDPRNRPTPASIVARLAPGLAAGAELGAAPLPRAALELIDEYRAPARTPGVGEDVADDATIGSQPALGSSVPWAAARRAVPWAATRRAVPWAATRSVAPWAAARSAAPAAVTLRRRAGERGLRRRFAAASPATRRALRAIASVAGGVALVAAGWAVGIAGAHAGRPPPPAGLLPPPPSGQNPAISNVQPGVAGIELNQPTGDSYTVFVVHGQGWPVGKRVTVTLVGVRASPIHPVADLAGTFNYAINQDHEFFRGWLPPGTYTVRVTDASGASAEARFVVRRA
jgi:hypothetical protein